MATMISTLMFYFIRHTHTRVDQFIIKVIKLSHARGELFHTNKTYDFNRTLHVHNYY